MIIVCKRRRCMMFKAVSRFTVTRRFDPVGLGAASITGTLVEGGTGIAHMAMLSP